MIKNVGAGLCARPIRKTYYVKMARWAVSSIKNISGMYFKLLIYIFNRRNKNV